MKKSNQKTEVVKKVIKTDKLQEELKSNDFYIVGLGASAGGLEALSVFFDHTPIDSGMAFIVVQHLDPTHKSMLVDLLSDHTKMKVKEASHGEIVKPNFVYIIPPNKDLGILRGSLQLIKPNEVRGKRKAIDSFFKSLAQDQKEKAIGIILSGTGTDGTLGLAEIKSNGGISLVEDPKNYMYLSQ